MLSKRALGGLAADHANAQFLAGRLQAMNGDTVFPVETNILIFEAAATGKSTREISAGLKERGVLMNGVNDRFMCPLTHYDLSRGQCAEAMDALEEVCRPV